MHVHTHMHAHARTHAHTNKDVICQLTMPSIHTGKAWVHHNGMHEWITCCCSERGFTGVCGWPCTCQCTKLCYKASCLLLMQVQMGYDRDITPIFFHFGRRDFGANVVWYKPTHQNYEVHCLVCVLVVVDPVYIWIIQIKPSIDIR